MEVNTAHIAYNLSYIYYTKFDKHQRIIFHTTQC